MENKKVVPMWVSIILVVLCGVAFFLNIRALGEEQAFGLNIVISVIDMLAVLLAVCYCLAGYEKASAFLFKAVIFARVISIALLVVQMVQDGSSFAPTATAVAVLGELISFGFMFVFGLALDIGKKRSIAMAVITLVFSFFLAGLYIGSLGTAALGNSLTNVLFYLIFLIMVIAKYKDKAARGSK